MNPPIAVSKFLNVAVHRALKVCPVDIVKTGFAFTKGKLTDGEKL